jgi:ribosomal protein L37AE/L43A
MPCYRCGTRQVDPARGSSPWLRGVRADRQVLICPDCQADGGWLTELDRCPACTSTHLVRRLGEVECRDCGAVSAGSAAGSATGETGEVPDVGAAGLAEEVEQALARVLRQPSARSAGIA